MVTFKAVILTGKLHIKSNGTSNIKIRITHNQKQAYISTDLYINPDFFNNKTGFAEEGKNKNYINGRTTVIIEKYKSKILLLGDRKFFMKANDIKEYLINKNQSSAQLDFIGFLEKLNIKNMGTWEQYNALTNSLKSFCGNKIFISDINLNFLYRYEDYLRTRGVENGIINYMRTFRAAFNKARNYYNDEDTGKIAIPQYPFRKYKFPKHKNRAREHTLTLDELRNFLTYNPVGEGEIFAKNVFLLMIYLIGIESKDLFYLSGPVADRVQYVRFKTGGEFSIKLEPEAGKIIKEYRGGERLVNISRRFRHHKSFYRYVNMYLHGEESHKNRPEVKGIFPKLGINKQVTTKWARHTWATIARNDCRINKDDVALCLGHKDSDNIVTDMYIKYDYSIIDEANRKVIDKIHNISGV